MVERGCAVMAGHCLSRWGAAEGGSHSLLPAVGFTVLVPGLEEKTETVAASGPSES